MSIFLRNNFKLISTTRLRIFSKMVHHHCSSLNLAKVYFEPVSRNKSFATVAHSFQSNPDFGNSSETSEVPTANADAVREIDKAFSDVDYAVRRTGRTIIRSVENIFLIIENIGFATETQSLYLLRCCGLLHLESPGKRVELVDKIWNKFQALGIQLNVKHYNALLKVYLDSQHTFSPSEILISMERHNIEPNQMTYVHLMERYCQEGNLNGSNEILEHMKEKGIPVNEAVFNSLLKGHLKINDISGIKEVMEVMKSSKISPSAESYTILACVYAERGNLEKVEEMFAEAQNNGVLLQNRNYLQVIVSLTSDDQIAFVDKLLNKMENIEEWQQDFLNASMKLMHKNLNDIAFKLILAVSKGENGPITNTFIKQLIKSEKPIEKIVQYCKEIYDKDLNSYIFINASKASIDFGKIDYAFSFFDEMQKRGIPVRTRNLWPIFSNYRNSTDVVWKTLKKMCELGLAADFLTYNEYIFPALSTMGPEELISKIQDCGQSISSAIDPLFQHYCSLGKIDYAFYLTQNYPVRVNSYFNLEQFLSLYQGHPNNFFKVLKHVLENFGLPGQNLAEIRGQKLALFIKTSPKVFEAFTRSSIGQQCNYSKSSLDVCKNILIRSSPELLVYFRKLGADRPTSKPLQEIAPEEEEKIINSATRDNPSKYIQLMDVLSLHIRKKDIERFNRVKSELDKSGLAIPPVLFSQVFSFYCEMSDLEAAEKTMKKIKEAYPNFKVDTAKLFDYTRLLVKFSKLDGALEVLKNDCKEINNFGGKDVLMKSLRRLLSIVLQTGDIDFIKGVQTSLGAHAEHFQSKTVMFELLIKFHLYRNDFESCLNEFNNCVVKHGCAPCLNLLMKKLILAEDQSTLQSVINLASKTEGNIRVHHELVLALVETDHLQQATKVLESLDRKVDFLFLEEAVKQFHAQNRITELENLLHCSSGIKHSHREELYHPLFQLLAEKNDCERISQILDLMKIESVSPSARSKQLINSLFLKNNLTTPFSDESSDNAPNDVVTDVGTSDFLNFLSCKDAAQALSELDKMKKGYIRNLSFTALTELVALLVQNNRLKDLSMNIHAMSYIIENSSQILKPLLENYAQEGNVDSLLSLTQYFPDFALKKCYYNSFLGKAYMTSNRPEEFLSELESRWNKKHKLFSIVTFEQMLKLPHLEERVVQLAEKYVSENFDVPLAVVWAHYFSSENYDKASKLSQVYPILVDKVDVIILKTVRQNENIAMGKKYVQFVDQPHVRERSKERAYGTLLDVLVFKQMYDEAADLVMEAKSKNIDLGKHYQSTLTTLKSSLERENKSVPYTIPT